MQNDTNLPEMLINSLLSMSKGQTDNREKIENLINKNLSASQKDTLSSVLSDPEKINRILSSPQAKMLLKRFSGGDKKDDGLKQH